MIKSILVAYDGSASSEHALDFAIDLARRYVAKLHVLTVKEPPDLSNEFAISSILESSQQASEELFSRARRRLDDEAPTAVLVEATGFPGEEIVHYANTHEVDHIVVGHRGHALFERWMVGAVSREVITHALCSATVVR